MVPEVPGRWYEVRDPSPTAEEQAVARISALLDRYAVITRGAVNAEGLEGGFSRAYQTLRELEAAGQVLRGYIVDRLGGAQFATPAIVDRIRQFADSPDQTLWPSGTSSPTQVHVLSAVDPASPYGATLPWPDHPTARPSRSAGALVVIADGVCLAHLSRGGRQLTLFDQPSGLAGQRRFELVLAALVTTVEKGRSGRFRIEEINGEPALSHEFSAASRGLGARIVPQGIVIGE